MPLDKVAAGICSAICEAGEARLGVPAAAQLEAMAVDAEDLREPSRMVPLDVLWDQLLFLREHTGRPGVGVELGLAMADLYDLRAQGFWGYALLSSLTLRQRGEMHMRYQHLRYPAELTLEERGDTAILESRLSCAPHEAVPILQDCNASLTLTRFMRFFHPRRVVVSLNLDFPEQPYHRPLREMITGSLNFSSGMMSMEFPAKELDFKFNGDPYLNRLAQEKLDELLARVGASSEKPLLEEVREQLVRRLARDATLERVARDLRLSARTLQRKLGELGASFHELLEQVRKERAHAYLADTDAPVDDIAARLGYGDPANFRRAFRRWTGMPPTDFRAQQRGQRRSPGTQ